MIADLRSDTVTKPTPGMLEAMMYAEVGDDVFGEDPTIKKLEAKCASLLGMESAVYCPSGTMTNQIGIKVLTQPYDEVICYQGAHIYKYEGGGLAGNSNVSVRLLSGDRGRLSVEDVTSNINSSDSHYPITSVVALENTVVREAGSYYDCCCCLPSQFPALVLVFLAAAESLLSCQLKDSFCCYWPAPPQPSRSPFP